MSQREERRPEQPTANTAQQQYQEGLEQTDPGVNPVSSPRSSYPQTSMKPSVGGERLPTVPPTNSYQLPYDIEHLERSTLTFPSTKQHLSTSLPPVIYTDLSPPVALDQSNMPRFSRTIARSVQGPTGERARL